MYRGVLARGLTEWVVAVNGDAFVSVRLHMQTVTGRTQVAPYVLL